MIWIKRILGTLAVVLLNTATLSNAAEPSTSIVRLHFIGANQLLWNTNAAKLKKIWELPQTAQMQSNVLEKTATALGQSFFQPTATNDTNQQALIYPLLEDLLHHESILELRGDELPCLNVAVQIDATRSAFWSSNLTTLSRGKDAKIKKDNTWSARLSPGVLLSFDRKDTWTVVTIGSATESEQFVSNFRKKEFSLQKTNWLEGNVNWARLQQAMGFSIPFKFDETEFALAGKADDLFTTVRIRFPEPFGWTSEPWHVPSVIRDPLVSFTASQPLAGFCKTSKLFEQVGLNPFTRQFYFWAQADLPFQTFGALQSRDVTNEIKTISPKLAAAVNPTLSERHSGQLFWNADRNELAWTNAHMMSPYLRPFSDSSGQFIVSGLFPRAPQSSPPPKTLFDHITSNSKLVYYDWEITQNRIGHWDMLTRVLPVFSPETITNAVRPLRVTRNSKSPAHLWIREIAALLGNTVTEVTVTGPNELTLKRKSHSGFTGMELVYFAGMADEKDFPLFGRKWLGTGSSKTK
ncbi:MAG: hypothetical protein JWM68_4156 [Verrucomicrobiales bacterium]|nr:hypothetical protein [Verrucomicrobiales bacterium]